MSLGLVWFNWIGAGLLIVGLALTALWANQHGYLTPALRNGLGALAALGVFIVGLRASISNTQGRQRFGTGVMLVGVSGLYLVPFTASQIDQVISSGVATALLIATTAVLAALATRYRSAALAFVGLCGGLIAPLLVTPETLEYAYIFVFLAPLVAGFLWVQHRIGARRLELIGSAGIGLYYLSWLSTSPIGDWRAVIAGLGIWLGHLGYELIVRRAARDSDDRAESVELLTIGAAVLGAIATLWLTTAMPTARTLALVGLLGLHAYVWRDRPSSLTLLLALAGVGIVWSSGELDAPLISRAILVTGMPAAFLAITLTRVDVAAALERLGIATGASLLFILGWLKLGAAHSSIQLAVLPIAGLGALWLIHSLRIWQATRDPDAAGWAHLLAIGIVATAAIAGLISLPLSHSATVIGVSVVLVLCALALIATGIGMGFAVSRKIGLLVLAMALLKLVGGDIWSMSAGYRIGTLMAVGVSLLCASFFYSRYMDRRSQSDDASPSPVM